MPDKQGSAVHDQRDSMRAAGAPDIRILNYRMNRRTDQRGVSPVQHLTLAVTGAQTKPFIWCGQEVTCNSLHAFPPESKFDAIGPGGDGGWGGNRAVYT